MSLDTDARSAMVDAVVTALDETDASTMTIPSSPPALSCSNCDTSSLRSESLSDDASRISKTPALEDVSFNGSSSDDGRSSMEDCNVKPESRPTLRRPVRKSPPASVEVDTLKRLPALPLALREQRRSNGRAPPPEVLRDQSLNLPHGRSLRRGYTSPSSIHLTDGVTSRSPSPGKSPVSQMQFPRSPQTTGSLTPRTSWSAPSPTPGSLPRRQSWQPGRKTLKQLEAEYNDHDDEEVPDDAILENVPITPIPGLRSHTPSPHRRPSHPNIISSPYPPFHPSSLSHSTLHSAKVPRNAKRPSAPTIMPNGQYGSPRSPRHSMRPPMSPHSATVSSFPPTERLSPQNRSKSWTEDLNDEARQLSAALEAFADRASTDKTVSGTNSAASSPPRPSLTEKHRAKTSILELPLSQKGSVMMDPLPISKEKEAVLSQTRPSWLPPKNKKEERKHLKEWENMMARAAEAEKKRVLKLREQRESQQGLDQSVSRLWDEHVLPNWETVIKEPRTRELWWRGVAPRSRGQVWRRAIGNELGLTPASFDAALRRAGELEEQVAELPAEEARKSKEAAWLAAIDRDVPNVYPSLGAFAKGTALHTTLTHVLQAYAMYRSDVGYVYGLHLVAGILCYHMSGPDAFVSLANLLNRPLPLAFLVDDQPAMARHYDLVLATLKYKSPPLHAHFTSPTTNIEPADFLDPMFRCLFAYNLSPEHVSRIWDVYVFEGDCTLIRAAVAVLAKLEGGLYGSREEVLGALSWRNEKQWDVGSPEELVRCVREAGKVDDGVVQQGGEVK